MNYVIQPGDNLWSIAQRFGTTVQAIMQANRISDPSQIYAGLTIFIPIPGPGPGPVFPPFPPGGGVGDVQRRLTQLERAVQQLDRRVDRLERITGQR
ncbi:LysM domain-containing protein [Xylanibacillus composti]|uniref:LysM domain-containing protein n=1 Tax=Xylanibacillus composti TaxID=1572762 RepID=A0A8J4M2P9_9BACL|nr:LysM domain-containing protein [Xylanibacillus composti]MDT9725391.1 LysM domain-containing protein [Xylanibacillus composti]GIQ69157.1 hypothetical protein XYCOK13_19810 [Xylanibacillus composti]